MVGFPLNVDRPATLALLKNDTRCLSDELKELIDLDFKVDFKAKATLHSILAGSIRTNSRLARSHGLKPQCRCGAEREDVQHVFDDCPDHNHIRNSTKSHWENTSA